MMNTLLTRAFALLILVSASILHAQAPNLISYQGRIVVGTANFDGTGQFKFALVNGNGSTTFWSNDGTSTAGSEPIAAVSLPVVKGLYSVQLGDTTLANMTAIPTTVFNNADVRIRVWFNNGVNGSQLLTPDQRLVAAPFAVTAGTALSLAPQATDLLITVFANFGSIYNTNALFLAPFQQVHTRLSPTSNVFTARGVITFPAKRIVKLTGVYSIANANVTDGGSILPSATIKLIQRASDGTETVLDTVAMNAQGANVTASDNLDLTLDWSNNNYFIDVVVSSGTFFNGDNIGYQGSSCTLHKVVLRYE